MEAGERARAVGRCRRVVVTSCRRRLRSRSRVRQRFHCHFAGFHQTVVNGGAVACLIGNFLIRHVGLRVTISLSSRLLSKALKTMGAAKKAPAKAADPKATLAKSKADAAGYKCVKCMQVCAAKRSETRRTYSTKPIAANM